MFKRLILLPALLLFTAVLMHQCTPKSGTYDTTSLHEATSEIQEAKKYLLSVRDTIQAEKCPELAELELLMEKEENLFEEIQLWITDSVMARVKPRHRRFVRKLLSQSDRVVVKEKIPYPSDAFRKWFLEEIVGVENRVQQVRQEFKIHRRKIKRCVRNHNICKDLLASGSNHWRVKAIKKATRYHLSESLDTPRVAAFVKNYKTYQRAETWKSPIFTELQLALIYQLRYRLTGDTSDCHKAHIRWNALSREFQSRNRLCEINFLGEQSQSWAHFQDQQLQIDSAWVVLQKKLSGGCTPKVFVRGCPDSCATNFDPLAGINDRMSCRGCMDSLASNYCPSAAISEPCIYRVCTDECFDEYRPITDLFPDYDELRGDMIVSDLSACKTDICGCTDNRCKNYSETAQKDDGSCNCACLDPSAVNYLPDSLGYESPPPAAIVTRGAAIPDSMTLNGKTYYHVAELCHWRGCTDPCALNFNPKARINDNSCECSPTTRMQLLQTIQLLKAQVAAGNQTPDQLNKEKEFYISSLPSNVQRIARQFRFSQSGNSLLLSANIRIDKKIKTDAEIDGIPLGEYYFPALYAAVDTIIEFMETKAGGLGKFRGLIVGEADGHRIAYPGIKFGNNGAAIAGQPFRKIGVNINTGLEALKKPDFNADPNDKKSLFHGKFIRDNDDLSFARAYLVKQRLLIGVGEILDPDVLQVCAKANTRKGKKFRKVAMVFTIDDYFDDNARTIEEIRDEIQKIEDAVEYYDKHGYPSDGNTYFECPCYEDATR